MDRERHSNGDHYCFLHHKEVDRMSNEGMTSNTTISSSLYSSPDRATTPPLPPSCSSVGVGVGGCGVGVSYIEHRVSKMDTLAGVAIKYGVEVSDIKRINGLVTDLQMFALKSLHIPLPGRHPPSPSLSNDLDNQGPSSSEQTPPRRRRHSDLFESFSSLNPRSAAQQRISPAMSNLRGYYGLKPTDQKTTSEGFEMAVYGESFSHYVEDGPFSLLSPLSNPPLSRHTKSKSFVNGFLPENGRLANDTAVTEVREGDSDIWNEKLLRRRQKSEADFSSRNPEKLLKEDNSGGGFSFSAMIGKGLALRPKAASRTHAGVDAEVGLSNPIPIGFGDSVVDAGSFNRVRKSSSTPSLQDQDNGSYSSSIWPTSRWSLKPDLQALSTAAITRPIFDGFPNPMTGRRNKAALD